MSIESAAVSASVPVPVSASETVPVSASASVPVPVPVPASASVSAPAALDTLALDWIPLSPPGLSARPLSFQPGYAGYHALLRVEPGTVIPRHRHTGEVHAYHLSGQRLLLDTGEIVGPGGYLHESVGNVDSWSAIGDQPCIIYLSLTGSVEYLDDDGNVLRAADARSLHRAYLDGCVRTGRAPLPHLATVAA